MTGVALGLVLAAALLHAIWNFLTKKSRVKAAFIWWSLLFSLLFYFPMFLFFLPQTAISMAGWGCVIATAILHALYFWFLGRAYESGDLSIVYPLARGIGPLLVPFLAVGLIREQLSAPGILGIALIILGIYVLHLSTFTWRTFFLPFLALRRGGSLSAMLTGLTIAFYSIVDKVGVNHVSPPVYIYLMFVGTWILLCPQVMRERRIGLKLEWQNNKGAILMVGFLVLLTYLLVLFAMQMGKVSYIAALRETSILFSVFLGTVWLHEKHGKQKLIGGVLIFLGVILIGLSK